MFVPYGYQIPDTQHSNCQQYFYMPLFFLNLISNFFLFVLLVCIFSLYMTHCVYVSFVPLLSHVYIYLYALLSLPIYL